MKNRLREVLSNQYDSYMIPFLWMHGESQERLYEEILAIKNCGIKEFCAESRPYENFCTASWWEDFGFLLKTAKELDMKVWLLDDKKFPTGYANGYLEHPERQCLRKQLVREKQCDAAGPVNKAKILIDGWLNHAVGEEIIGVTAYRHSDSEEQLDFSTGIDLTDLLSDGCIYWDIPEGVWRICVVIKTTFGDDPGNRLCYYIDMLNKDSCHALIEAVYQPHYEHFAEYFGTVFRGFFSDEPGFLNSVGSYSTTLGIPDEKYPWCSALNGRLGAAGENPRLSVPGLWEDFGEDGARIRMNYMDEITRMYRENFSLQLGDWCRVHEVMYIGHVIEDSNAHTRLGYGAGHYFRALDGQDMAGIDIVLMQEVPGITDCVHRAPLAEKGYANPEFFHYMLPKLASSHSHIQPLKKGRAMCEIFGAFGWAEGLPYMKQLADLMLSSGINHFVPHAFSPKKDDSDCPPHFYNGGENPQYPLFGKLTEYMSRCSHLLYGGVHQADVAVFYNAEGEWTGGKNELVQKVCASLTKGLVDYDIVPFDALKEAAVKDGKLQLHEECYQALIVSEAEIMPYDRLQCFFALAKAGLKVIFTNRLPRRSASGEDISCMNALFSAVPLEELTEELRRLGMCSVTADRKDLRLRYYHVKQEKADVYLFSNEAVYDTVEAELELEQKGQYLLYEPWSNRLFQGNTKDGRLPLSIEKGNAVFVLFGIEAETASPLTDLVDQKPLNPLYDIFIKEGEAYRLYREKSEPVDITAPECIPKFSGEILYQTELEFEDGYSVLDLGDVGETAEVWINGSYAGARINAPYRFDLSSFLVSGKNKLEIKVINNNGHRKRDVLSHYLWLPPSGITGPIYQCKYL